MSDSPPEQPPGSNGDARPASSRAQAQSGAGNIQFGDNAQLGGDVVTNVNITQLAASTGAAALRQLPAPPADFTGRKAELDELRAAASQGGAATFGLRGQGGVGKTALALMLAHDLAPACPDAQRRAAVGG